MAHVLQRQQTSQRTFDQFNATIRAFAHSVAADHALALRATTEAALPRQRLAEVRAMYVSPRTPGAPQLHDMPAL